MFLSTHPQPGPSVRIKLSFYLVVWSSAGNTSGCACHPAPPERASALNRKALEGNFVCKKRRLLEQASACLNKLARHLVKTPARKSGIACAWRRSAATSSTQQCSPVAQSAEHSAVNRRVVGSSPTWGANCFLCVSVRLCLLLRAYATAIHDAAPFTSPTLVSARTFQHHSWISVLPPWPRGQAGNGAFSLAIVSFAPVASGAGPCDARSRSTKLWR